MGIECVEPPWGHLKFTPWKGDRCNMPTVGYSPLEVLGELQHHFANLDSVVGAYMRYDARSTRITVISLLAGDASLLSDRRSRTTTRVATG
jgi:hypothetical protein